MTTTEPNALTQARAQLDELIAAARTGAIIPIRLTGQLEAVAALLAEVEAGAAASASQQAAPGSMDAAMQENAEFWKIAIHELRTPMTSIRGYSDMLNNTGMAGPLTEMQGQLLQVIRSNSRRMETLLSDMSYINKIRAGIVHVTAKMDTMGNIAMMLRKKAEPLALELKREITFDIPQGLPILNTDAELLTAALMKLIENGLRYSTEGSGQVTVRAQADGSRLLLHIEDNGIGMSAEELGRLGTLYYRSDNEVVRAYKGSGLGVAIAYGLIAALGGTHQVESTPGQGTRYVISLPGMV
jgi:signal transduction histidine kinase